MLRMRNLFKGFTLIELTVVIIIIAILVAAGLPQFVRVIERSRVAKAQAKLESIKKAEAIYFANNSSYTNVADLTAANSLSREIPEVGYADPDWTYSVTGASTTAFTAAAKRVTGQFQAGKSVTLDQTGTIGGDHPAVNATSSW